MENSLPRVPLLTGSNYLIWAMKMKAILSLRKLHSALYEVKPEESAADKVKAEWKSRNQQTGAYIRLHLSDEQALQFATEPDAWKLWSKIKSAYAGAAEDQKIDAGNNLKYLRMGDEETVKPPYVHVTQIGDPVLRAPMLPIEPQVIPFVQFQVIIAQMKEVMKIYNCVGLAAPQIGLPWQVFMMQVTEKQLKKIDESIRNIQRMELVPLQIFINPTMKTLDHKMVSFPETCASVLGYNAVVPRAKAVEITALNDKGEEFTASFKDWTARIVQHEMDHLKGILYTDKMDRKTFTCSCWNEVNTYEGNVELRFDSQS